MKTNKYRLLVLSDSKISEGNTLKSTISLAKMIDGQIMLFSIKDPSKVVKETNQLSAMREINHQFTSTNNNLKRLAKSASEQFGVNINSTFIIGRLKDEISQFLKEYQPDVVVLGKKKRNILNFSSDSITDLILNTFSGPILVTDNDKTIKSDKSLALGVLNSIGQDAKENIFNDLLPYTNKPIKLFKIIDSKSKDDKSAQQRTKNTIEFVFEQNDSSLQNLSKYIDRNGINLLYLNRRNFQNKKRRFLSTYVNKLNVPMLLSSEHAVKY